EQSAERGTEHAHDLPRERPGERGLALRRDEQRLLLGEPVLLDRHLALAAVRHRCAPHSRAHMNPREFALLDHPLDQLADLPGPLVAETLAEVEVPDARFLVPGVAQEPALDGHARHGRLGRLRADCIRQRVLLRFLGHRWAPFGSVVTCPSAPAERRGAFFAAASRRSSPSSTSRRISSEVEGTRPTSWSTRPRARSTRAWVSGGAAA